MTSANEKRPLATVGAVFAGLVFIFVTSTIADVIMHATGVFPPMGDPVPDRMLAIATAYRIVFSIAGCYLTARLAPNRPMHHALWLGAIGVVISLAGLLATWNGGAEYGAKWYPILLVIVSLPCAWAGGKLYVARTTRAA